MISLEPHPDGVILPVRAQPGSRKNELRGEHEGMLKVCVTQAPEKGKANKAVAEFLAKSLGLAPQEIPNPRNRPPRIGRETCVDQSNSNRLLEKRRIAINQPCDND
jgi:hypothetical protein